MFLADWVLHDEVGFSLNSCVRLIFIGLVIIIYKNCYY
jgi:hypothetical protein